MTLIQRVISIRKQLQPSLSPSELVNKLFTILLRTISSPAAHPTIRPTTDSPDDRTLLIHQKSIDKSASLSTRLVYL